MMLPPSEYSRQVLEILAAAGVLHGDGARWDGLGAAVAAQAGAPRPWFSLPLGGEWRLVPASENGRVCLADYSGRRDWMRRRTSAVVNEALAGLARPRPRRFDPVHRYISGLAYAIA